MLAEQLKIDDYLKETISNLNTIDIRITAPEENISEAKTQINLIHEKDDGFITVAIKKEKQWVQYHYKIEELKDNIGKLLSIEDINIYISPNSFYKPFRRIENVRKLNSLYIDLDYYKLEKFKDLTSDQIIWQLEQDYFNVDVPEANFIVITGRGLAIYWLIEPVPYKALPLWNAVQKYFLEKFKDIGGDAKSIDSARVMRLSGGVNQKSNKTAKLLVYSDKRYVLKDIQREYLPKLTPYIDNPYYKKKGRKAKVINYYNLYRLHYARLRDLVKLVELREGYCRADNYELVKTGQREFICFLYRYLSCCYSKDFKKALEDTLEFNNSFVSPLSENEVIKATKRAEKGYEEWLNNSPNGIYKRGGYNYTNKSLIDKLNITEEEMKYLITIISKKEVKRRNNERTKESQKAKRRNKKGLTKREQAKLDKIEAIKELRDKGLTQREIAKKLGVDIRTVKRYYIIIQKNEILENI